MGHEQKSFDPKTVEVAAETMVSRPLKPSLQAFSSRQNSLQEAVIVILTADPNFKEDEFLSGAKEAFKFIVTAFHEGNLDVLKPLVSKEIHDSFASVLTNEIGQKNAGELIKVHSAEIFDAKQTGQTLQITVKFISDQKFPAQEGEGNRDYEEETVTDIWTFSRDIASHDPNWTLVETSTPS